jgi:hypothetical protein
LKDLAARFSFSWRQSDTSHPLGMAGDAPFGRYRP